MHNLIIQQEKTQGKTTGKKKKTSRSEFYCNPKLEEKSDLGPDVRTKNTNSQGQGQGQSQSQLPLPGLMGQGIIQRSVDNYYTRQQGSAHPPQQTQQERSASGTALPTARGMLDPPKWGSKEEYACTTQDSDGYEQLPELQQDLYEHIE